MPSLPPDQPDQPSPDAPRANPLAELVTQLQVEPPRPRAGRRRRHRHLLVLVGVIAAFAATTAAAAAVVDRRSAPDEVGLEQSSPVTEPLAGDATATIDPSAGDPTIDAYRTPGWIAAENARPGTGGWQIPDDKATWEKIRGYAGATSIDHGQTTQLYVNTGAPTWHVEAYRMGYYQNNGARLVWWSTELPGRQQAPATVDPTTRMREARWESSLDITAGADWPPGQYMLKLVSSDGGASFVPLVVRDDGSQAALLVQSSVTTWQAYNGWGDASLYTGGAHDPKARANVVSFDRPYDGNGSGEFFGREFEFISFAERHGFDVTYWTDVDLHDQPERVKQHRALVSLGHDEYYTTTMRKGLESARDAGVNLAFFGANEIFRKIRLEPSPLGPSRHEVNYRSAATDPMNQIDKNEVTVSWRDAPSNNPESALVGNYYECNPVTADWVVADASAWMFEGSGFANGDSVPGMVGNEYDRVTPEAPTPRTIQVLAHSPVTCRKADSFADTTYYSADSGAGVFAAGTFWWIPRLLAECPVGVPTTADCKIQKVTENLLNAFAAGPAGAARPSRPNLDELGIKPGYLKNGRPKTPDPTEPDVQPSITRPAPAPAPTAAPTTPAPTVAPPPTTPPTTKATTTTTKPVTTTTANAGP